jgi:hypothetical protein
MSDVSPEASPRPGVRVDAHRDWRLTSGLGAASGLAVVVLWSPMALVVPELPSLATASGIDRFYAEHGELIKVVLASVSVGFAFFFVFLGALIEQLRRRVGDGWTWTALASALMFITSLGVALGLDAAAALLHGRAGTQTVWGLHSAAFLLAAPAAGGGVAFFVSVAVVGLRSDALPRWSGWLSVMGIAINAGALGGFFATAGALNSGNGLVGGLTGPVLIWLAWIMSISLTWLSQPKS